MNNKNNNSDILKLEETIKKAQYQIDEIKKSSEFYLENYFRDFFNDHINKLRFGVCWSNKVDIDYITVFDKDNMCLIQYDSINKHIIYSYNRINYFLKTKF